MGDLRSFFAAGKAAPIGNTRYPSGYGLTQRRHRPFRPTRRSALGLFHPDRRLSGSGPFRHARHAPPASTGKSASTGESAGQEHRSPGKSASTGKSTSPGKSVGQEHRSPGKSTSTGNPATRNIVRPENPPRPGNPPAQLTFQQSTAGPTLIPPGTRPVRLCPAPLSFTGTFYAPFPSPQHVPRIAPPAEWHAP